MPKISLKHVADQAGVDPSTVSRILNQSFRSHRYSKETILKVQRAAESLGYSASRTARSLRTGKSAVLGLILPRLHNPFFSELAEALEQGAREKGYRLWISSTGADPAGQSQQLQDMMQYPVEGLLLVPRTGLGLKSWGDAGLPLVTLDRSLGRVNCPHVGLDDEAAARQIGAELVRQGYPSVQIFGPTEVDDVQYQQRWSALKASLPRGMSLTEHQDLQGPYREACASRVDDVLRREGPAQAWVGLNNVCSMGILEGLSRHGFRPGKEAGLIGIDDFFAASLLHPGVTVLAQPVAEMAEQALSLLMGLMRNPAQSGSGEVQLLAAQLRERGSLPPFSQLST